MNWWFQPEARWGLARGQAYMHGWTLDDHLLVIVHHFAYCLFAIDFRDLVLSIILVLLKCYSFFIFKWKCYSNLLFACVAKKITMHVSTYLINI